jgi:hypothetical protein
MKAIVQWWQDFWFTPTATSTIAVFRIVHGFVVLLWASAIAPDVLTFFSQEGVLARQAVSGYRWGLLELFPQKGAAIALLVLLFVAGFCLMIGFRSRLAALLVFVALLSFARRNPWVFNAGDSLLRHMALFLSVSHCGAALSVDARRKDPEAFWRFPLRAPWALRLMQVQVSILYLFTVWAKARGERWIGGTAVAESLRVDDLTRFDLPYRFTDSLVVANLLTFGTIVVELSLAILIWNRKLRPIVIALGIALHLFIELSFALGFFSMVIIMSYISFVPEDTMARFLTRLRDRLRRSRMGALRRLAQPGGAVSAAEGLEPARP